MGGVAKLEDCLIIILKPGGLFFCRGCAEGSPSVKVKTYIGNSERMVAPLERRGSHPFAVCVSVLKMRWRYQVEPAQGVMSA